MFCSATGGGHHLASYLYTAHTQGVSSACDAFYLNSLACILDIQFSRTFYEGPFPIRAPPVIERFGMRIECDS